MPIKGRGTGPKSKLAVRSPTNSSTSRKTIAFDLRCYKHSPRVKYLKEQRLTIEQLDFEATQWEQTFATMGRLHRMGLKEAKPFTKLNETPYHCVQPSRVYSVCYGKISHAPGGSVKGSMKPKKETKISLCNCIDIFMIPKYCEPLREDVVPMRLVTKVPKDCRPYIPISSVVVRWDDKRYNMESICDWLQRRFGNFWFTIRKASNVLLCMFEKMEHARSAVTCPMANTGITITWFYNKFNNFGALKYEMHYDINEDNLFQKMVNRQFTIARARDESHSPSRTRSLKFAET